VSDDVVGTTEQHVEVVPRDPDEDAVRTPDDAAPVGRGEEELVGCDDALDRGRSRPTRKSANMIR
jgi:hypothetical protein